MAAGLCVVLIATGMVAAGLGIRPASATPTCEVPGPDLGGYTCDLTTYSWADTTGGTTVTLWDDDVSSAISLPFTFPWYGQSMANVYIGSNGLLCFGPTDCSSLNPLPPPTPVSPDDFVACFWEDLNPAAGGTIRYKTTGSAPNRLFVVEFNAVPHYFTSTLNTFQFQLAENGEARCMYSSVAADGDTSLTAAGTEDSTGAAGVRYKYADFSATNTGIRFTPSAPSPDPAGVLHTPPSAYWKFDEGTGTTALDYSGNSHHGAVSSGSWHSAASCKSPGCLGFDGVYGYVSVPNAADLNPQRITVEAWVKSNNPTWNATGFIVSHRDAYILHPIAGTKGLDFYIHDGTSWVPATWTAAPATFDLTSWHHYAGTYDGSTIKLYVDGVQVASRSHSGLINNSSTSSIYIGRDDPNAGERFGYAFIDEVAIYRSALSAEAITARYAAGFPAGIAAPCEIPGPDAGGYTCDSVTYSWADTSGGTTVSLTDESMSGAISLPFPFAWYGQLKESVYIGSNGLLCFNSSIQCTFSPTNDPPPPNPSGADDLLACFWEDLDPGAGGTIRYKTIGSAPNRLFVAEFNAVPHYSGGPNTFQLQLIEGGGARCMYSSVVGDGDGPTAAGTEDSTGNVGVRYKYADFSATNTGVRFALPSPSPPSPAVAYWKLDEGVGTTANDFSGNGNNATLVSGPSWQLPTSCLSMRCLSFDGTDDYVNVPNSLSLSLSRFTVSAWVYPQAVKPDYQPLITKQSSTGGSRNYGLFLVPNTSRVHYSFQASDSTWYSYNSVGSLAMNQWNHVVMTYDRATFSLYFNGVLDSSHGVSAQPFLNTEPVKIGRELSAYSPYQGGVDEVSIYNRGLSAIEVEALYTASGLKSPAYADSDKVGLEDFYSYRYFDLGADAGYLNLATGNLVVQATDIAAPGVGLSMRLTRTYNQAKDSVDGPLGRGWTLGVADGEGPLGQLLSAVTSVDVGKVAQIATNPDSFDFFDADGTRHHFVKPLGAAVWQSPPGVNLFMTDYFVGLERRYKATRPDGVVYEFVPDDVLGAAYHLATISDRNGNTLTFGYSGSQLTSVTDPSGRVLTLSWVGSHITGASFAGLTSSYAYSGDRLSSASAGGRSTSYTYNSSGMATATDGRGNSTSFTISGGVLTSLTDRGSKVWNLTYNNPVSCQPSTSEAAGATCVTDPEGNSEVYTWSRGANLLSYRDAGDETASGTRKNLRSYVWAANRLASMVNEDGASTEYGYNQWGQVIEVTNSGAGEEQYSVALAYKDVVGRMGATELTQVTEGAGSSDERAWAMVRDSQGNLTTLVNPEGRITTFTYLSGGLVSSTTDPRGKTTTFSSYHASGRPQTVTDPLGHSTTYAYNVFGKPTSITDRNSNSWSFGYDGRGNLTSVTTPNGSASWGFDSNDNLTSDSPLGGPATSISYDARDLPSSSTVATRTTTYTYYDDGALKEAIGPMGASQKTTYQRFPNNRVMAIIDPEGAQTDFTYTPAGLPKTVIYPPNSPLGTRHATVTTYNRRGQAVSVLESGHSNPTTYTYNPFGELTSVKTPRGSTTTHAYDKMGRVIKTTDAAGRNTTRAHDPAGNLIALVQPTGSNLSVATQYGYTDRNEIASETDPADLNHTIEYSYDNEGRQRYRYDKYSGTTERTIEQIFRGDGLVSERIASGSGLPTFRATFTYDGGGKPTASTSYLDGNTVSSISASYNTAGELSSTTETIYPPGGAGVAKTVSYGYQSDGLLSSRTVDGSATNYEHYLAGTEKKTIPWGSMGEFVSTHNPNGSLASQTLPNGSVLTQTYDLADRILSKTVKNSAGDRLSSWEAVAYDEGDNRLSEAFIQKQIAGSVPDTLAGNSQYGYDSADRQISYKHPIEPDATHYGMDDAGNVVSDKDATYNYANNRLLSRTPNDSDIAGGPFTYSYDHFGNQTASTQLVPTSQTTTTAYDAASHTKRVTSPDGSWVEYGYDGFERMAYRKEHPVSGSDVVTLFFHDGLTDQIALETDSSGTIKTRYILDSTGDPIGKEDIGNSTGRSYYVDDLRGNLVQMLDGSQNVVATFAFDAYGEKKPIATRHSGNWDSRLKYQMAPEDPKTGNYNLGPRIFAPKLTRFTSFDYYPDALDNLSLALDPLTQNKFVYAGANPSSLIDDGHKGKKDCKKNSKQKGCKKGLVDKALDWLAVNVAQPYVDVWGSRGALLPGKGGCAKKGEYWAGWTFVAINAAILKGGAGKVLKDAWHDPFHAYPQVTGSTGVGLTGAGMVIHSFSKC